MSVTNSPFAAIFLLMRGGKQVMQETRREGRKIEANRLQHMSVILPPSLLLGAAADQLIDPVCQDGDFENPSPTYFPHPD